MNCTHPVIYNRPDGSLYCHICGATIEAGKSTAPEEKPAEAPKRAVKRKTKQQAD